MAAAVKFNQFVEDLAEKVHNLGADTLKVALTNTTPVNTNTILADITQIANGNGYTTGGTQTVISSSAQTSGTYKLVLADVVFTAAGGSMGPFQWSVLYNDTPTSPADPLILFWNYGSAITLLTGETFTWDADATTGIGTLV
jgi:hypothetical protein